MKIKASALLTGICLGFIHCATYAENPSEPIQTAQPQQIVSSNPEPQNAEPVDLREQALTYYRGMDYEQALPSLKEALQTAEDDIELNSALLDLLLEYGMTDEASKIADRLERLGATDMASFGQALVQLQEEHGDRVQAKKQLSALVYHSDDLVLAGRAADALLEELYNDKQFDTAYTIAQTMLGRDPDTAYAYRLSFIRPEVTASPGFSVDLGYRFDYDDNVAYPDEKFASGQGDYRHVFIADVLYDRSFGKNWNFYTQGHFLQSLYHEMDQFNQTRVSASVAIGQSGEKYGWRIPVEFNQDWLDGDSYRTSLITRPGFYAQFGTNFYSHFYGRLQNDDYDTFPYPEEDRSGDVYGGGILVAGQASTRFQLHSYIEYNHYDTNGEYWQRHEFIAFAYGEIEFSPKWVAGLALRYQKDDYDNARPVFADRQRDRSKELYLNLTHKFTPKWRWRGQFSMIKHGSNIAIFDYNRNVYSLSIIREF